VNPEDVSADYNAGILKITLGKRAEAKPKQIKVNIGEGGKVLEAKKTAA
jgi:HSP20 family protein